MRNLSCSDCARKPIAGVLVLCCGRRSRPRNRCNRSQLLHTFTPTPEGPNGRSCRCRTAASTGVTSAGIYRLAPAGQVTIAARLTERSGRRARWSAVRTARSTASTRSAGSGGPGHRVPLRSGDRRPCARCTRSPVAIEARIPFGGLVVAGGSLFGVTALDRVPAAGSASGGATSSVHVRRRARCDRATFRRSRLTAGPRVALGTDAMAGSGAAEPR